MLAVLGPLVLGDGITPRSRAQRIIASALVLDSGAVVSADRLAELVWGDDQPDDAGGALQSHVSRLRRLLPADIEVTAEGSGYLIHVPDDRIDVVRFEASYRRACDVLDDEDRLNAAEAALALWRGLPYPDLDDLRATAESVRLVEIHDSLTELRAQSLVRLGRPDEAIAGLEALRVDNPLRERTIEWLMRAYVGSGRKVDALAAFRTLRESLIDQTGLDPSPELRELEIAIITEEFVGFPAEVDESPTRSRPPVAVPASTFVGRDVELAAVTELLGDSRIVSLVGPGGVGKTRLAMHSAASAAARFDDGVDVVELASLRAGGHLPEAVATVLAIQPRADATATERIIDAVGDRRRLIVLDNCEHIIDEAARFVDEVVRATRSLTLLTTSREPLNIDAEIVVRVEPLTVDGAAVELFADRAAGMVSGVPIDGSIRPTVRQICASLDGLPLAIELAAAQMGSMTLEEIEAGVTEPLEMLRRGRRNADRRHGSLRNLVEWSVRGLDENLLAVFTTTAAFAGSFTVSDVAAVGGYRPSEVRVALAELVDRSLLVLDRTGSVSHFRTLETIRAFAAELLAETDRSARIRERHSDWILGLVDGISSDMDRWATAEAARVIAVHLADLRMAHRRFHSTDDADRALRLAAALHYEAYYGMHGELFAWITETADRFGTSAHRVAETVLASASIGAWLVGDLDKAADYASRAAQAIQPTWPGAGRGAAESGSDVLRFSGDHSAALAMYARAVALAREENNLPRVVTNLADGAMVAGYLGDVDAARAAVAEARELVGIDGPVACMAWLEYAEGEALAEHDPAAAKTLLARAVELAELSRAAFIIGVTRLTLTGLQLRAGDPTEAVPGTVALMEHWRQRGARIQQWITLRSVIELFLRLDDPGDAAAVLGAVLGSGTAAEATGADAERLSAARATIIDELPDGERMLAAWADCDQDAIVDHALGRLRSLSPAMSDPMD